MIYIKQIISGFVVLLFTMLFHLTAIAQEEKELIDPSLDKVENNYMDRQSKAFLL
jgi:hypothetical protein